MKTVAWAIVALFICRIFEQYFDPVVTGFVVDSRQVVEGSQWISGRMEKRKTCRFVGLSAIDDTGKLWPVFDPTPLGTRPAIPHAWGPWRIDTIRPVTLWAIHQCHPLWNQQTKLTEIGQ